MKIHSISALGAFAFSLLFYSKSFGLNVFLISILVVVALALFKKTQRLPWIFAIAYLFTAAMVFIDPTGFKIFIYFMSFLLLVGKTISNESSLYVSWFMGVVNMLVASMVYLNESQKPEGKKISPKTWNMVKGSLVALVLLVLFSFMYRTANPVFDDLLAQIDLSFISLPWLFFTLMGYLIFLHLLRPYYPKELIILDQQQLNDLRPPQDSFTVPQLEKLSNEQALGGIVFVTLNLLLLFYLITDVIYLSQVGEISNSGYSMSVHQEVYALMLSIVCAIIIILYFFRGNLNFFKGNKRLKVLSYVWIGLNLVLVAFTWYKNYEYVDALGLTYKRIGVFVYLLLTVTGLVTALLKVVHIKSFVFLVRANFASLLIFLLVSASIPWDRAITLYNLEHIKKPDIDYLVEIGYTNSQQLYEYVRTSKVKLPLDLRHRIDVKYDDFLEFHEERSWQEYTLYQFSNYENP